MTNAHVVQGWVSYCRSCDPSKKLPYLSTASLHCSETQLFSYATPIAKFKDDKFYLTSLKYSVTTSKHQYLVKHFVTSSDLVIVDKEIKEVR